MGEGGGKGFVNGSVGMVSMMVIFVYHMAAVFCLLRLIEIVSVNYSMFVPGTFQ